MKECEETHHIFVHELGDVFSSECAVLLRPTEFQGFTFVKYTHLSLSEKPLLMHTLTHSVNYSGAAHGAGFSLGPGAVQQHGKVIPEAFFGLSCGEFGKQLQD